MPVGLAINTTWSERSMSDNLKEVPVPNDPTDGMALLSFSLGPVQGFIATARTVRDLWTGSYLLSHLTFAAMKPILEACGPEAFLFPNLEETPQLRDWKSRNGCQGPSARPDTPRACLPNRFIARVPEGQAAKLADKCETAVREEWVAIAEDVRSEIEAHLPKELVAGWDRLWDQQIDSFFEVRTVVLPAAEATPAQLESLALPGQGIYAKRLSLLGGLLEARRSVRHVPDYDAGADDVPQKCTLMGTYEQMGPARLEDSRQFWEQFAKNVRVNGTRTRVRERLCAVALVKRFAWAATLHKRLGCNPRMIRFDDTATVAAQAWFRQGEPLRPDEQADWSGHWLHWSNPKEELDEGEPEIPIETWRRIQAKRSNQGPAPKYYAVLALDGDNMGKWIQGELPKPHELNQREHLEFSQKLNDFALKHAERIVNAHDGQLIYAGGDDVLAMLPTASALACGDELQKAFRTALGVGSSASAGIAVGHYLEDLRVVLEAARQAEKRAKAGGRNALGLAILKRSGEASQVLLPWDLADDFTKLVNRFVGSDGRPGASDRWAYKLRADLDTLCGLENWDAVVALVRQTVQRVEDAADREFLRGWAEPTLDAYQNSLKARQAVGDGLTASLDVAAITGFVTLCQSASFLARGRDSR
jgi:CRISPR-associated protein Cmr2